jgi:hypothetical protein
MALRTTGLLALAFAAALAATPARSQSPSQPQSPAQSQGRPPQQAPTNGANEVDRQVSEMRRQMVEGREYRSHVRVAVRLKNGNRITGVVKDGFVVERIDGMRFVAAEASEAGAGMRLYYWNGRRNYVFLPFKDILEYRISERLTTDQVAEIERELRAREALELQKEREAAAAAAAAAAAMPDASGSSPTPLGEGGQEATPAGSAGAAPGAQPGGLAAELQGLFALTQEFPPSAGWNQKKRDEISRRMAVVGAKPSAQEKKFVDRFADWQRACALFGVKSPKVEGADEGSGQSKGSGQGAGDEPKTGDEPQADEENEGRRRRRR